MHKDGKYQIPAVISCMRAEDVRGGPGALVIRSYFLGLLMGM